MKKLCVFDLDGTLVNSIYDIAEALNASLASMGKPIHPIEAYYQMVGDGMELLCRRALPDGTEEELQTLIYLYKERYIKNCCVLTRPYDGILELLAQLNKEDFGIAVLSNKPQEQTERVVSALLGKIHFFDVIGQSERFPKKPDPMALYYLIEKSGVSQDDVWYIGDSDVDIHLGKSAKVKTIGAAWGFRGSEELHSSGADWVVDSPMQLKGLLFAEKN